MDFKKRSHYQDVLKIQLKGYSTKKGAQTLSYKNVGKFEERGLEILGDY